MSDAKERRLELKLKMRRLHSSIAELYGLSPIGIMRHIAMLLDDWREIDRDLDAVLEETLSEKSKGDLG